MSGMPIATETETTAGATPGRALETNPLVRRLARSGVLAAEDRQRLAGLCAGARPMPAETVLIAQGGKPSGLHLVVEGFAYRYKLLPDGRRQILGLLLPGEFCDLQAVVLRRTDHFIAMLTDGAVAAIGQETVDELTLTRSRIARALWWSTLVDESVLREWLASMGQRPADRWLAHFFCELHLRLSVAGLADPDSFEMPLTQEKIADVLGITPVHVNRVLKELRERDLLRLRGRRAEIPDRARLRAFCGFDPAYLHLSCGDANPRTGDGADGDADAA